MTRSRATLILVLAFVLVILHIVGLSLEFYWRLSWYDRVVHILAGATAALTILSLNPFRDLIRRPAMVFVAAILISLIIGIIWEIFEIRFGITRVTDVGYPLDTTWDIISDGVGGILVACYLLW